MNKPYKENILTIANKLREESKLYCVPGEEFDLEKDSHRFFVEVLTELIVRECANAIESGYGFHRAKYYSHLVKQKFGIE